MVKYCAGCGQEYEGWVEQCADCGPGEWLDARPEVLGSPLDDIGGPAMGEAPGQDELEERCAARLESWRAMLEQEAEEVVMCAGCAAELAYGTPACTECGEEIWYGDDTDSGEFGDSAARVHGWSAVFFGPRPRAEAMLAQIQDAGVRAQVAPIGIRGVSSAEGDVVDLVVLSVWADEIENADPVLNSTSSATDGVTIEDPLVAQVLLEELVGYGVSGQRDGTGWKLMGLAPDLKARVDQVVADLAAS